MFERAFEEVSDRRAVLPLSLNRLPIISIPISGATAGSSRAITMVTAIGNRIFSLWDTVLSCSILSSRSCCVVRAFIIGGCIIGTRAIYEYAATAIGPTRWSASFVVR